MTSEGFIPHLKIFDFLAPVVIDVNSPKLDDYHAPLKVPGFARAYALPGGKRFLLNN